MRAECAQGIGILMHWALIADLGVCTIWAIFKVITPIAYLTCIDSQDEHSIQASVNTVDHRNVRIRGEDKTQYFSIV